VAKLSGSAAALAGRSGEMGLGSPWTMPRTFAPSNESRSRHQLGSHQSRPRHPSSLRRCTGATRSKSDFGSNRGSLRSERIKLISATLPYDLFEAVPVTHPLPAVHGRGSWQASGEAVWRLGRDLIRDRSDDRRRFSTEGMSTCRNPRITRRLLSQLEPANRLPSVPT
jgi:hypothetical protein